MFKYELYESTSKDGSVHQRVRFPEIPDAFRPDTCESYFAQTDNEGRIYFAVPNLNEPRMHSFRNRPKDAYDCILTGNGDALSVNRPMGAPNALSSEHVYYFVDREYGESLRQQFIEGWKTAKFGYLLYVSPTGFGGGTVGDKSGAVIFMPKKPVQYMLSIEEAEAVKKKTIERVDLTVQQWEAWYLQHPEKEQRDALWKKLGDDSVSQDEKAQIAPWLQVFDEHSIASNLFELHWYREDGEASRYHGADSLEIIQALLPHKGHYFLKYVEGNSVMYFDSNFNRVKHPHTAVQSAFTTNELVKLGKSAIQDELGRIAYDHRFNFHRFNFQVKGPQYTIIKHIEDYLYGSADPEKFGLCVPNKWAREYHKTDLAKTILSSREIQYYRSDIRDVVYDSERLTTIELKDIPETPVKTEYISKSGTVLTSFADLKNNFQVVHDA